MDDQQVAEPENTAVRVALWRAMHVLVDAPPHVFVDEVGLSLVAPDEGFGEDDEKDEVAEDVGFDGGVASPEESAMHIATDEPGNYGSGFGTDDDGDDEGLTEATAYRIENEDPMNELDSLAPTDE